MGGLVVFSALIPIFIIYLGLRMMKVSDFPFLKALFITAFGLIGGSVTSAFILDRLFPGSHVKWGGAHGIQIERILESSVGWPGVVLIILLFLVITVVIFRKSSIYKIKQTLVNNKPPFPKHDDAAYAPEIPTETEPDESEEPGDKKPGLLKRLIARIKEKKAEAKLSENMTDEEEAGMNTGGITQTAPAATPTFSARPSFAQKKTGTGRQFRSNTYQKKTSWYFPCIQRQQR